MKTIGELLEDGLSFSSRGLFEQAFIPVCEALERTAAKIYQGEVSAELDFQRFIKENWRLISFMGIPRSDSVPSDLPFGVRRAIPSLNMPNLAQEIVIYAVRQTLHTRRFPFEIGFSKAQAIKMENEKLLFPQSLLFSLVGCVVFNPINKDEKITGEYWLNFRGFQMFISELWGRNDLIERVMRLYKH